MTREDIIRWAREADLLVTTPIPDDSVYVDDLYRFAALVAAAERERICAIVYGNCASDNEAERIVRAIRGEA